MRRHVLSRLIETCARLPPTLLETTNSLHDDDELRGNPHPLKSVRWRSHGRLPSYHIPLIFHPLSDCMKQQIAAAFSQPPPITPTTATASKQIDPIDLSRKSSGPDPVVLARQSPGAAAVAAAVSLQMHNTPDNSAQLGGAHVVALPPPTSTAFHSLDGTNVGGVVDVVQQEQKQKQQSASSSSIQQQQHQLKQPPASVPAFKSPQQSMQKQSNTQTQQQQQQKQQQSPSSSPAKKQSQQSISRRTAVSSTTTAEDGLDTFLRGGESTTSTGIIRKIRPSPLPPNQIVLQKSQTLATRRAWGDVIRVTNDALLGKENGLHHVCYSVLLAAAAASADPVSFEDVPGRVIKDVLAAVSRNRTSISVDEASSGEGERRAFAKGGGSRGHARDLEGPGE